MAYGERDLLERLQSTLSDEDVAEATRDCVLGISRKRKFVFRPDPDNPDKRIRVCTEETELTKPADRARGLMVAQRIGLIQSSQVQTLKEISTSDSMAYSQFSPPVDKRTIVTEDESG